jgi:hypothetical protein
MTAALAHYNGIDYGIYVMAEDVERAIESALLASWDAAVEACAEVVASEIPRDDPWWQGDESSIEWYRRKLRALKGQGGSHGADAPAKETR